MYMYKIIPSGRKGHIRHSIQWRIWPFSSRWWYITFSYCFHMNRTCREFSKKKKNLNYRETIFLIMVSKVMQSINTFTLWASCFVGIIGWKYVFHYHHYTPDNNMLHAKTGPVFSYKLRYIVGLGLVEMAISTIYRNLYLISKSQLRSWCSSRAVIDPNQHNTLIQCRFNVWPPSATLVQYYTSSSCIVFTGSPHTSGVTNHHDVPASVCLCLPPPPSVLAQQ